MIRLGRNPVIRSLARPSRSGPVRCSFTPYAWTSPRMKRIANRLAKQLGRRWPRAKGAAAPRCSNLIRAAASRIRGIHRQPPVIW